MLLPRSSESIMHDDSVLRLPVLQKPKGNCGIAFAVHNGMRLRYSLNTILTWQSPFPRETRKLRFLHPCGAIILRAEILLT